MGIGIVDWRQGLGIVIKDLGLDLGFEIGV